MTLEITDQFKKALECMESHQNVFITGKAGTGKSTLLRYFKEHTKKNIVVLSPTGVAAVNIGGQTIHSFFKFAPHTTLDTVYRHKGNPSESIYKKMDTLVIDEISMVRADLLDCVDKFMRLNGRNGSLPFGGVQLIFFGDLYQLPPVVRREEQYIFETYYKSPYFFSSHALKKTKFEIIELDKIYRQSDPKFIDLLNAIRNNQCTREDLEMLNSRLDQNFRLKPDSDYICLTPRNDTASYINETMLQKLPSQSHVFNAEIKGKFSKDYHPVPETLEFKEGARVLMANNDTNGRWKNGSMGAILEICTSKAGASKIHVQLDNGESHWVTPYTWEVSKFVLEDNRIQANIMGKFKQFPMILAWAMTIHKSQGKTFDRVVLDLKHGAFSPGQVYVALSRCTSLEGIILTHPITPENVWVDATVKEFMEIVR